MGMVCESCNNWFGLVKGKVLRVIDLVDKIVFYFVFFC